MENSVSSRELSDSHRARDHGPDETLTSDKTCGCSDHRRREAHPARCLQNSIDEMLENDAAE